MKLGSHRLLGLLRRSRRAIGRVVVAQVRRHIFLSFGRCSHAAVFGLFPVFARRFFGCLLWKFVCVVGV